MNLPKKLLIGLCALWALFPLSATLAQAQQSGYSHAAPTIDGFDVEAPARLAPGNELLFTLHGSPGGTATLRINGVVDKLRMEEVEAGVYEGSYTIRGKDRIARDTAVTANLRVGNRVATHVLDESLLARSDSRSEGRRAAAAAMAAAPRIERFEVDPAARLNSGADLFFSVHGSPGATASVRIDGVKGKLSLHEAAAGVYEGAYTIKERDRISANSAVTATLRRGEHETSAVLGQSLLAAAGHPPSARAQARHCANCGVVESINVVEVNGEGGYLGKIAGGVVGAAIGSQIGQGRGKTAAEIAGAVGGVVAGNEVQKRVKKTKHYDVTTRLQGGGTQTISYETEPAYKVGDKVRVENGALLPN